MNDRYRLKQLHVLKDRLERLPASPNRDWMLNEVRARAVDVETGVRPGPIRPRNSDDATAEADAGRVDGPKRRGTTPSPTAPSRPREIDRPATVPHVKPRTSPARERARVAEAAPFERMLEASVKAQPRAREAASDERLDLLEHGGELCLGDPPAEAPEDAALAASRPWARGLRG